MASTRQIINDLRAQARALDGRHLQGTMMDGVARSLRRGADELERIDGDLFYYRAAEALPEEDA
ncbi:MAG: hypothetical protein GOVbin2371_30 [Prokaryotic dsDNA virus sp.]|nr:hypothetical protein [Salipiger sp.]QDP47445.1 MAG: hypothetical protein GOVbin2371_30 [Prokaryotic dsDNA virus sp.]|tara:strand:+ start:8677 stop:8868 length:192 start_codon:yes stop_codon:yes gene_type:complete